MNDGKMVENAKGDVDLPQRVANETMNPPQERALPKDHVARTLTMRDRNYIVGAVMLHVAKKGQQTGRNQNRLALLTKIFLYEETLEFFAQVKEDLDGRRIKWDGQKNLYVIWQQLKQGAVSLSDVKKDYPSFEYDPEKPPPKPQPSRPGYTEEEKTGPSGTFHLHKKLDDWIREVLQSTDQWSSDMYEGAEALFEQYGIFKENDI